jgi:hypothetical protein
VPCIAFAAAVISAAVNVICELARKNPKNYLPLAPTLFKILQSSTNNWMLIKIIKLVLTSTCTPCCLMFIPLNESLHSTVWSSHSAGEEAGQAPGAAADQLDQHDHCHVSSLRVHPGALNRIRHFSQ